MQNMQENPSTIHTCSLIMIFWHALPPPFGNRANFGMFLLIACRFAWPAWGTLRCGQLEEVIQKRSRSCIFGIFGGIFGGSFGDFFFRYVPKPGPIADLGSMMINPGVMVLHVKNASQHLSVIIWILIATSTVATSVNYNVGCTSSKNPTEAIPSTIPQYHLPTNSIITIFEWLGGPIMDALSWCCRSTYMFVYIDFECQVVCNDPATADHTCWVPTSIIPSRVCKTSTVSHLNGYQWVQSIGSNLNQYFIYLTSAFISG